MSLIQEMIAAGVNIHNPQAVFDYYHNTYGQGGGSGGLTLAQVEQVEQLFNDWGQSKLNRDEFDQALENFASASSVADLETNKVDKTVFSRTLLGLATVEQVQDLNQNKLNRSEYIQHFKGLFHSKTALMDAVLNPVAGDYANVDLGQGEAAKLYLWDVDDSDWVEQKGEGVAIGSSDNVPEGNQNLYFTEARVLAVLNPILGQLETIADEILGDG